MRILVVQESDWLERGPHQSHHLFERLSQRGHTIRVVDFEILWRQRIGVGILSKRKEIAGVHKATEDGFVTVIRPSILRLPILSYLSMAITHRREIRRQLKDFKPDVVVGFSILNSALAISLCKRRNVLFVYYLIDELHRLVPETYLRSLARLFECWNLRNASVVISINEALKEYATFMGAREDLSHVVPGGVDLERFEISNPTGDMRREMGISDRDIALLFMGWLYDFSGLVQLAKAVVRSGNSISLKLIIIGKGESLDELRAIKNKEDREHRIILVDWVPYCRIPDFLSAADICVLPALNVDVMKNIVPIKMYEYMAAGKPVIATRLPGLVTEFGEDQGVVYVDTPEEVVSAVARFSDSKIRDDIGRRAKLRVGQQSWNDVTNRFEKILASLSLVDRS